MSSDQGNYKQGSLLVGGQNPDFCKRPLHGVLANTGRHLYAVSMPVNPPDPNSAGAFIRDLREARGLTQKQAAAKANDMWDTRWSQIENGETTRLETLLTMAQALSATPAELEEIMTRAGHGDLFRYIRRLVGSTGQMLPLDVAIEATPELDSERRVTLRNVFKALRDTMAHTGPVDLAGALQRAVEEKEQEQEQELEEPAG